MYLKYMYVWTWLYFVCLKGEIKKNKGYTVFYVIIVNWYIIMPGHL